MNTDVAIMLLSTSWFCKFIQSLDRRSFGIEPPLETVQDCARIVCADFLGGQASYFQIDLSDERRKDSYEQFISSLRSRRVDEGPLSSVTGLISSLTTEGSLSEKDLSLVNFLFASASVDPALRSEFRAIGDGIADEVLAISSGTTELLEQSTSNLTEWDRSLSARFGGQPELLVDVVGEELASRYVFDSFVGRVHRSSLDTSSITRFVTWIAGSIKEKFKMEIAAGKLFEALSAPAAQGTRHQVMSV